MRLSFELGARLAVLCAMLLAQPVQSMGSCDPIRTFADGKTPLREIFVSPSGDDSRGRGSEASPYQSIRRALQDLRPGDAIRLLPGRHTPGAFFFGLSGTPDAPIWLGGAPGQPRPVFAGGSQALHLSRVRYLIVENLEVTGAALNGINCDDGGDYADENATHHLVFRNISFRDVGQGGNQDGLKLSGVNDFFVLDCEFARISAGGSGIDHVGCHRGMIARSTFTDMGSNSIQCKGGSEDIEIRGNRFFNGGARAVNVGGSTGFEFFRPPLSTRQPNFEAKDIRVVSNLFQGSDAPVAFVGAVECLAAHNTIVEPRRWVMRILQETLSSGGYAFLSCGDNRFLNNLVYFDRAQISTYVNIGPNTSSSSFEFAHNLWHAFNQPSQSRPGLPAAEVNGLYGVNPRFQNAAGGDYSVAELSPAAGKGKPLPNVRADLREKCFANPPTIGAWEANPPPPGPADSDGDQMPDSWEDAHGLNKTDPSDAMLDLDRDGLSNFEEYMAGTHPKDSQSVFALGAAHVVGGTLSVRFNTATGRVYQVESIDLAQPAVWAKAGQWTGNGSDIEFRLPVTAGAGKLLRVKVDWISSR